MKNWPPSKSVASISILPVWLEVWKKVRVHKNKTWLDKRGQRSQFPRERWPEVPPRINDQFVQVLSKCPRLQQQEMVALANSGKHLNLAGFLNWLWLGPSVVSWCFWRAVPCQQRTYSDSAQPGPWLSWRGGPFFGMGRRGGSSRKRTRP